MTVFETVGRGSIPRWGAFEWEVGMRRSEWHAFEFQPPTSHSFPSRGLAAKAPALQAVDRWFESTRDDFLEFGMWNAECGIQISIQHSALRTPHSALKSIADGLAAQLGLISPALSVRFRHLQLYNSARSSIGSGHRLLKPERRVRFPYELLHPALYANWQSSEA